MRTLALLLALVLAGAASDPKTKLMQYRADAKAVTDALTRHDDKAAEIVLRDALRDAPQRPVLLYNLASLETKNDENAQALILLRRYAQMGILNGAEADSNFPTLAKTAAYKAIKARMVQNASPVCSCETIFTGTTDPFIAEGIARDTATGRIFVAGVHARRIIALADGKASDFVASLPEHYSPFGIAVDDAHNRLWVSAAVIMQSGGGEVGKSALIAFDLATGALLKAYPAPTDRKLAIGDIALGPDGSVYVSDSNEGSFFVLKPGAEALAPVGKPAMLVSAQGMVVSRNGKTLLVADYAMGLLRVNLETGKPETVAVPANVTTIGIDGIARLDDGSFVATQNGFKNARIVHLRLSPDWSALRTLDVVAANAAAVSDPSLVTADGKTVYVVGVAQWASFDDDKPDPVRPIESWKILKLKLD